jgi:uncharacterized SAM-binding protein YcdF (DUF218 family)
MQLDYAVEKSDCIFVLCSNDTRVAEYAAELYLKGDAETVIFSGGAGRLTQELFERTEAETFAQIALDLGVPSSAIITETRATNTGENIQFTAKLLKDKSMHFDSFILVQKPYMERRSLATFEKQWPQPYQRVLVTSQKLSFVDYFNDDIDLDTTVRAMLGDYERIKTYPDKGFQTKQLIPSHVEKAYKAVSSVFN